VCPQLNLWLLGILPLGGLTFGGLSHHPTNFRWLLFFFFFLNKCNCFHYCLFWLDFVFNGRRSFPDWNSSASKIGNRFLKLENFVVINVIRWLRSHPDNQLKRKRSEIEIRFQRSLLLPGLGLVCQKKIWSLNFIGEKRSDRCSSTLMIKLCYFQVDNSLKPANPSTARAKLIKPIICN